MSFSRSSQTLDLIISTITPTPCVADDSLDKTKHCAALFVNLSKSVCHNILVNGFLLWVLMFLLSESNQLSLMVSNQHPS